MSIETRLRQLGGNSGGSSSGGAAIGSSISGGTPNRVLYIDANGNLAVSDTLQFIGTGVGPLTIGNGVNSYVDIGSGVFLANFYPIFTFTNSVGTDIGVFKASLALWGTAGNPNPTLYFYDSTQALTANIKWTVATSRLTFSTEDIDFGTTALSTIETASFGATIDGGGSVLSTGANGQITVPYKGTIIKWYIKNKTATAGESGSIVFDIKRSGTSIVGGGGNKPTVSAGTGGNAAVSGWTSTAVTAGDSLEFNIDSVTTFTWINLVIEVRKS